MDNQLTPADSETAAGPARRMNAIVQRAYGASEVLEYRRIDRPAPGPGEVVIEVKAAGLDRGTWHVMKGLPYLIRLGFGFTRPKRPVPGLDVSGVVSAIGEGVTRFVAGDEVFGIALGSFAEFARAKEKKLARKPANVSFEQAAVTAVSGLTAYQALHEVADVKQGDRVLVIGASGGVGSFAVQIAAAAGAVVTGVASADKAEFVESLGAARVVDYRTTDVTALDSEYDIIVDINGRNPVSRLRRILSPRGVLVLTGGEDGDRLLGGMHRQIGAMIRSLFTRQRLRMFISTERQDSIQRLAELLADGTIVSAVGATYPLEQAGRALEDLEAGRLSGKAAILVNQT